MERHELVIVGGGLAAARAVASYRGAGGDGRIALVGEEETLPYHRPALSKKYLRGEKREIPFVEDEAFYAQHGVDLLLGTAAESLDFVEHAVTLADGTRLGYGKLLVATGASPRRLPVPGTDLDGVFALRTVGDSAAIRDAAASGGRAVVVGGGFIGMEAAASLRQLGLDVTLVHLGGGLFDQLGSPDLSEELAALYRRHGIELLLGHAVARFGGTGSLAYVETADGRRLDADLAVVGAGVVPNVGFLAGSGVVVDDGVVVDARFETSAPDVYAAGDVASFFDPLFGRRRRVEHWSNARDQGDAVGRALAGASVGNHGVSSFFSEVFGTTIKVFGDVSRFDACGADGTLADGFLAVFGDAGRIVGAITVRQTEELEALVQELIAERAPADALERELVGGGWR